MGGFAEDRRDKAVAETIGVAFVVLEEENTFLSEGSSDPLAGP